MSHSLSSEEARTSWSIWSDSFIPTFRGSWHVWESICVSMSSWLIDRMNGSFSFFIAAHRAWYQKWNERLTALCERRGHNSNQDRCQFLFSPYSPPPLSPTLLHISNVSFVSAEMRLSIKFFLCFKMRWKVLSWVIFSLSFSLACIKLINHSQKISSVNYSYSGFTFRE